MGEPGNKAMFILLATYYPNKCSYPLQVRKGKMKLTSTFIFTIIAAVNVITVIEAQQCPDGWFNGLIMVSSDAILPASTMEEFPDPNSTFYTTDLM